MKIELIDAGKRFNREWIFRHANLSFTSGVSYAVTGANGSGKSTLLQCIGGLLEVSEGSISYNLHEKKLQPVHPQVSFSAPYADVIEEMTLFEFLEFHVLFKPLLPELSINRVIEIIGLKSAQHKQIRYYSSGMKQRVKLAQAMLSNTAIILLDEPCSNLDPAGIDLYHHLISTYTSQRLVIVCSNDETEYGFCDEVLSIHNFKSSPASSGSAS